MNENTFDPNVLNISTKVHPAVKEKLRRLCAKRGLTEYEMLQMVCDCIVRYMDDRHNLTPELEQAMSIFEHMVGWRNAYNLADPTIESEVQEAVYITSDGAHKKKGFRAHLVRKPFMGEWEQTDNVVQIFERMTEVLLPETEYLFDVTAAEDFGKESSPLSVNYLMPGYKYKEGKMLYPVE